MVGGVSVFGLETWSVRAAASQTPGRVWPVEQVMRKVGPEVVGLVGTTARLDALRQTVRRGQASGSGVIFRSDGYIVTNYHVIQGMNQVKVILSDGRTYPGKVVGTDPATDLAVVKIPAKNLPTATFASAAEIKVGELAVAIGNPLGMGFSQSVTAGVVSGLDRSLGTGYAVRAYRLIQTDAAINPGNSGGALADAQDRIIGINSVKIATPGVEGMSFAIPAPTVEKVVNDLIRQGRVVRPWLGLGLVGKETAVRFGLPYVGGLLVGKVYPGSPAAAAGLRRGDTISSVNGRRMDKVAEFLDYLNSLKVGETVEINYRRADQTGEFRVKLAAMPPGPLTG